MATFQNQASLTYNNSTVNSNIVTGEILEVLSLTKASLNTSYTAGDTVTYILSAVNSGSTAFSGVSITDNLGAYSFGTNELYPLSYVDGSAMLYIDGVMQPVTVNATESEVVFSGFTIPAGGNALISYRATVNGFAPLLGGSVIENTATLTAAGLSTPVTATAQVGVDSRPVLSITKGLTPESVPENGTLTYTLTLLNTGAEPAVSGVTVTDTFNPILSDISVSYNGTPWTEGVNYTYDEATGLFTTLDGQISVPGAVFNQNIDTGLVTVTPGVAVIRITGTV
ncbi:MAG: DUF11 domain-containing protein [Ruminococcaceae bacterium]|nr:DUF11 domain-containing protein [Oscillospiraceae bacterium]